MYTYVPFVQGEFERGLAIVRDKGNVWSLPLINGGHNYYDKDPYMPVPFQNLVLQGVPECTHGQLVPQLWMKDGRVLMPVSYIERIVPKIEENSMSVTCWMDAMCRMGEGIFVSGSTQMEHSLVDNSIAGNSEEAQRPKRVEGISDEVCYTFTSGRITREDTFTVAISGENAKENPIAKVRLVLLTYSKDPKAEGEMVQFGEGVLSDMRAQGYGDCTVLRALEDGSHDTPHGRLQSEVVWEKEAVIEDGKLCVSWTMGYGSR